MRCCQRCMVLVVQSCEEILYKACLAKLCSKVAFFKSTYKSMSTTIQLLAILCLCLNLLLLIVGAKIQDDNYIDNAILVHRPELFFSFFIVSLLGIIASALCVLDSPRC
jgi:hypothetical protein